MHTSPAFVVPIGHKAALSDCDPDGTGSFNSKKHGTAILDQGIEALSQLQELLFAERQQALLIVLQGMDTSGKDGTIKHVMRGINPQGCQVHSFGPPSKEELAHGYLYRQMARIPEKGKIGIFNRSYYEDVTVVRVHGKNDEKLWHQRFNQINDFERYLIENSVQIVKIFLHISKEEQKARLLKRIGSPDKQWKFDISDIRERPFWDTYQKCYNDVFAHTSTSIAPWNIVPANHKWVARAIVANVLISKLTSMSLNYPKPSKELLLKLEEAKKSLAQ